MRDETNQNPKLEALRKQIVSIKKTPASVLVIDAGASCSPVKNAL